jgi:hypothetical protein
MKVKFIWILMAFAMPAFAQTKMEVVGGYTVNNSKDADYTAKTINPFVIGANLNFALTKKKYSPTEVHLVTGARYMRTGMRSEGSIPDSGDFYEDNGAKYMYEDEANAMKLEQGFLSVPVGFEFKLRTVPSRGRPLDYFSLTVMLNNSMPISSQLTESLAMEDGSTLSQQVDLKPYLKKYYPGLTVELRLCKFLMVGVTHQELSFKGAADVLDFDDQASSAFYKFITDDGFYRDVNWYVGMVVPIGKSKNKK